MEVPVHIWSFFGMQSMHLKGREIFCAFTYSFKDIKAIALPDGGSNILYLN
jgi:hypothetical protein